MGIQHRPTTAVINLDFLRHNIREIKKAVPEGTTLLPIVKANAYGHGAVMVARTLNGCGIENLGVATVEEGLELRNAGIKGNIYILDGLMTPLLGELLEYHLTPVLHHVEEIKRLGAYLKKEDRTLAVHIKMDTGMGRLGILPSDVEEVFSLLKVYPQIQVRGVLTHLARADEADQAPTERQFILFDKLSKVFAERTVATVTHHIANSAAIIDGRVKPGDWARPGIVMYGAYPNERLRPKVDLQPLMTLKTSILSLKKHPQGVSISYGGTFTTQRESLIAILPMGYADGYHRLISNRGYVLVGCKRAPIVGRICMDLTLVDVTDIPGAAMGDEVIVMGSQGDETIRAEEIAGWAETISYEVFCGITARVPRVYVGM